MAPEPTLPSTGLRVGFIGTGWTERVQIPTFRLGGLTIQAICSGHVDNARRVAARYDIPEVHQDWRDLVESDTVDIVSIATPPDLHAQMAIAALQAGKHVICEKPTALHVGQAEYMFAAAQAAPDQLAIIDHELRFHPQRAHLRKLLRDGYIGNLLYIELDWRYSHRLDPHKPWSWHSDSERGGGTLGALGSHLIDLARWYYGRINALSAQLQTAHFLRTDGAEGSHQRRVTSDDAAHLMLQFAAGQQGRIAASAIHPENLGMSVLAVGTEGALKIDYSDQLWGLHSRNFPHGEWQKLDPDVEPVDKAKLPNSSPFTIGSYYLAKQLAASIVQNGVADLPEAATFYDGLVVQRALDAARRSQRDQVWVRL